MQEQTLCQYAHQCQVQIGLLPATDPVVHDVAEALQYVLQRDFRLYFRSGRRRGCGRRHGCGGGSVRGWSRGGGGRHRVSGYSDPERGGSGCVLYECLPFLDLLLVDLLQVIHVDGELMFDGQTAVISYRLEFHRGVGVITVGRAVDSCAGEKKRG